MMYVIKDKHANMITYLSLKQNYAILLMLKEDLMGPNVTAQHSLLEDPPQNITRINNSDTKGQRRDKELPYFQKSQ